MRVSVIGVVGTCLLITACGSSGGRSPTKLRPPSPVNLSVFVNDSRISVSPRSVGAGPVVFIVTNRASKAESLAISKSGATSPLASTAPINPQGTTQVSVNFQPGQYTIATAPHGNEAQLTEPGSVRSASIHIGRERPSASNQLLAP
jgi:hypothetical protein